MKCLSIIKGEEHKASIKDRIECNDIFVDEYKEAVKNLDEILKSAKVVNSQKEGNTNFITGEYNNNIIAFCGERGDGKSSAMLTFANVICNHKKKNSHEGDVLDCSKEVKKTFFSQAIVIDPTLFDGIYNVLDILLAKLYRHFDSEYGKNNQCASASERDKLINQFQMVYKYVSLINNKEKMLDNEYDYDGNISKLMKLGESTGLKRELKSLISLYLNFIKGITRHVDDEPEGNNQLVIAIDDLDLCSDNAYKMAEQIRKYLVIPNVVILMAVRVNQLELCVEEVNRKVYKNILDTRRVNNNLDADFFEMSEKYVAKLIPKSRRIYLPKCESLKDVHVTLLDQKENRIWDSEQGEDLDNLILNLISKKTGMFFLKNKYKKSFLIPNNLREIVNFIGILSDLDNPNSDFVYLKNIQSFMNYIENSWISMNLSMERRLAFKELVDMNKEFLHAEAVNKLEALLKENKIPQIFPFATSKWMSGLPYWHVFSHLDVSERYMLSEGDEKWIESLKILYTIKLNTLLHNEKQSKANIGNITVVDFMMGYIWGNAFSGTIPFVSLSSQIDRSRFYLSPQGCIEGLKKFLSKFSLNMISSPDDQKKMRTPKIPIGKDRHRYLLAWTLFAMFGNTYFPNGDGRGGNVLSDKTNMNITNNNVLNQCYQISIENMLVSLCDMNSMYDKLNMGILGIEKSEYEIFVKKFEEMNVDSILCSRTIASNPELALGLKKYCYDRRDYKAATEDDHDRSKKLLNRFLENIEGYMKSNDFLANATNLKILKFPYGDEEYDIIVADLYAHLIEACANDEKTAEFLKYNHIKTEKISQFRNKFENRNTNKQLPPFSSFFRNRKASYVLTAMENAAEHLADYREKNGSWPEGFDIGEWCELYSEILNIYYIEAERDIGKEFANKYKKLATIKGNL